MTYNIQTKVILSISNKPGNFGTLFHNYLYKSLNLDYFYKACTCNDLVLAIKSIKNFNFYGMSISMPFKQKVLKLVDEIDPSAMQANAINTIINFNNTLIGFNTDYYALNKISSNLEKISSVLIIGSGAMAEMCIRYYSNVSSIEVLIHARNTVKTKSLLDKYNISEHQTKTEYDLVINATPQEIGQICKGSLQEVIQNTKAIIDYPIMPIDHQKKFIAKKTHYISGIQITLEQAHKQFELYTNTKVSRDLIDSAYEYTLNEIQ